MSNERLTPTSYLVLSLLAREGPSTPYELKRHVTATVGNFWTFPHTLLYSEPPRLVQLGLATETREDQGRRRRVFAITPPGREALAGWLDKPAREPTELRDLGLLQLFVADMAEPAARIRIANAQLEIHRAKLAAYEVAEQHGRVSRSSEPAATNVSRTIEHWRGQALPMGLLYERAAIAFWEAVAKPPDRMDPPG